MDVDSLASLDSVDLLTHNSLFLCCVSSGEHLQVWPRLVDFELRPWLTQILPINTTCECHEEVMDGSDNRGG